MYMRTTKSGGYEYVSLAHNERDPETGQSRARILYNFGRKDQLDVAELKRLIASISRFLGPADVESLRDGRTTPDMIEFLGTRRMGATYVLDGLWKRLGWQDAFTGLLQEGAFSRSIERALFALVAHRAVALGGTMPIEDWVAHEAYVEGLDHVDAQQVHEAVDFSARMHDEIRRAVMTTLMNVADVERDVVVAAITRTTVEGACGDARHGEDFENRSADAAYLVMASAVTRDGLPLWCRAWPGDTSLSNLVEVIRRDVRAWRQEQGVGRLVMVWDPRFDAEADLPILEGAGDATLRVERLRLGADGSLPEALSWPGRSRGLYADVRVEECVTESLAASGLRSFLVHDAGQAERDRAKRDAIVAEIERRLAHLAHLEEPHHTQTARNLRMHPTFGRYLRVSATGTLHLDEDAIAKEAKVDGAFLVTTLDANLTADDVATGYQQRAEIARIHREFHDADIDHGASRREGDPLQADALLRWLAMLLIHITERESGQSWHHLKPMLHPWSVALYQTAHGRVAQTSKLTKPQRRVLDALELKPPPRFVEIAASETRRNP